MVCGGKVTQVTPNALKAAAQRKLPTPLFPSDEDHIRNLASFVARASVVNVTRLAKDKDVKTCLAHAACAVVFTAQEASARLRDHMQRYGARHRRVHFGHLNLARYASNVEEALGDRPTTSEPRLVLLRRKGKASSTSEVSVYVFPHPFGASDDALHTFVSAVLGDQRHPTAVLSAPPTVKWRSKSSGPPSQPLQSSPSPARPGGKGKEALSARERERRRQMDEAMHTSLFDTDGDDGAQDEEEPEEVTLEEAGSSADRDEL